MKTNLRNTWRPETPQLKTPGSHHQNQNQNHHRITCINETDVDRPPCFRPRTVFSWILINKYRKHTCEHLDLWFIRCRSSMRPGSDITVTSRWCHDVSWPNSAAGGPIKHEKSPIVLPLIQTCLFWSMGLMVNYWLVEISLDHQQVMKLSVCHSTHPNTFITVRYNQKPGSRLENPRSLLQTWRKLDVWLTFTQG